MTHRSVCRWVAKFQAGQQDLKDVACSDRPPKTTTKSNIKKITGLLNQDARYTLTLRLLITTYRPFADNVDQDQTAQNVQSDPGSTLSDKEIVLSKNLSLK